MKKKTEEFLQRNSGPLYHIIKDQWRKAYSTESRSKFVFGQLSKELIYPTLAVISIVLVFLLIYFEPVLFPLDSGEMSSLFLSDSSFNTSTIVALFLLLGYYSFAFMSFLLLYFMSTFVFKKNRYRAYFPTMTFGTQEKPLIINFGFSKVEREKYPFSKEGFYNTDKVKVITAQSGVYSSCNIIPHNNELHMVLCQIQPQTDDHVNIEVTESIRLGKIYHDAKDSRLFNMEVIVAEQSHVLKVTSSRSNAYLLAREIIQFRDEFNLNHGIREIKNLSEVVA